MPRKKSETRSNPFYGCSAEVIGEWCGVSVGTADHWKAGGRRHSRSALRLFRLYRDGKVLDQVWEDYRIVDGELRSSHGRLVTPSHLALYALVWQALAEKDPDSYFAILDQAREG